MKNITLFLSIFFFSHTLFAKDTFRLINQGKEIEITTTELEKMPVFEIKTATNFTPQSVFTGVRFSDLVQKYHLGTGKIRAFAWDDYSYTLSLDELLKYNAILAYKKDGNYIDLSELGPYVIIYPRDSHPELNTLDINAKTVWQVKTLEVLP